VLAEKDSHSIYIKVIEQKRKGPKRRPERTDTTILSAKKCDEKKMRFEGKKGKGGGIVE